VRDHQRGIAIFMHVLMNSEFYEIGLCCTIQKVLAHLRFHI
jgi:hypothetical protein